MHIQHLPELGWNPYFQSQLSLESLGSQLPFRVVGVQRSYIECLGLDADKQIKQLRLTSHHWRDSSSDQRPTIGDWLLVDLDFQPLFLLERKSFIKRKGAGVESVIQPIAANIDTLFIVSACNDEFNLNRIERYLAVAAESDIYSVVVLTKVDLCADPGSYLNQLSKHHPNLPVEMVNATDSSNLAPLKSWIEPGQTVALVGSSGVGKSTIINGLMGDTSQLTQAAREADNKGRHTTTTRSLHPLPGGGLIIDNPGMRELKLIDSEEGIRATFAEIEELARYCRFKDCQHQTEPGCAVIEAVKAGKIEQRRVDHYRKLLLEQARNNESIAERRHNDRALGRFYKSAIKASKELKSRDR